MCESQQLNVLTQENARLWRKLRKLGLYAAKLKRDLDRADRVVESAERRRTYAEDALETRDG